MCLSSHLVLTLKNKEKKDTANGGDMPNKNGGKYNGKNMKVMTCYLQLATNYSH